MVEWQELTEWAAKALVIGAIAWHGLTIKIGEVFTFQIYPARRFFRLSEGRDH